MAEAPDIKPPSNAESDRLMNEWASRNRLTRSKSNDWRRLIGKRSHNWSQMILPGDDHVTMWSRDGKPFCYVSQPYSLDDAEVAEMIAVAAQYGLDFYILTHPSWHYPGACLTVLWLAKGSKLWEAPATENNRLAETAGSA
jgi:hypothetical protein